MHMASAGALHAHLKALQDLALHGCAEPLSLAKTALTCRGL